jgi:2',3'-cyclic-nucleotide 2'-phosphodiesterase/3'-nucleotidase
MSGAVAAPATVGADPPVTITILHTNDFHGQLEASGSNPGYARVATVVNDVRTSVGAGNVLLADVGDEMQGSLLSNIYKGQPVIDAFNTLGVDVATFGNHEFDWGQGVLASRVNEAAYPYVSANIVVNDTGNCETAGWTSPSIATPWVIKTVGEPTSVKVGFIGVTTAETPTITIASATEGLCFKDPATSIEHYYDAMKAAGADVIVVLSHLGYTDGGYGYGIPVYGDQTLAAKLNTAGKHVDLILGGHSHTNLAAPGTVVGGTTIGQAYYNGRTVGRADITVSAGTVSVAWTRTNPITGYAENAQIKDLIAGYASDPDYLALVNQPVGYSQVDLVRDYNGDNMMGDFVDDAIYGALNSDTDPANDVDMFFNNAGGIRIDWCDKEDPANPGTYIWSSLAADCQKEGVWSHDPMLLTYGQMFQILPFGNATAVGTMTGAQVYDLLDQSATLFKGAIQPSGIRYTFFRYSDALPGPQPYAWGAYGVEIYNRDSHAWEPLDASKTYKVGTNEFLAPAGQDGYVPFKYLKNISYWGDMLNAVNAYVSATYPATNPYKGPDGDGTLDGRITRNGDGDDVYEAGEVVPLTILHHNDSHGNLLKGSYPGYTQLVSLINQARAHNPDRTLLLTAGDNIQGDSMMYYFKSAGLGYTSDGLPITDPELRINPLIKAFNAVGYDAMTLGNHEFNFGTKIFGTLAQADFPMLQANIADTGEYGLAAVPVQPYVEETVGPEGIKVAILGIGNHRVPNYELPSNIPGLTFTNPIQAGKDHAPTLQASNDVVIALTHIGFTTNPSSVEVDENVDTYFGNQVSGVDAIIGGHSHTNPATGFGDYKFLPTFVANPDHDPVLVTQAYRYNNTLGTVSLGLLPDGSGGYKVVSSAGRYESVTSSTPEDPATVALLQPYKDIIDAYNATVIGETTVPIDALQAFTQETNAANLQADASVYELGLHGITPDIHLSGAMTNRKVADAATPSSPVTLKVADMFSLMPYENSLVTMSMNGPQLKRVLERAYRNYYYYKYVPAYGGYSYYTTCMLDTNAMGQITYNDRYPEAYDAAKEYVISLKLPDGRMVDFSDSSTTYLVSTVNYLAAGSCNFNDGGVSLWPLNQIVNDTQYYVRDAVIDYITAEGTVSPAIEDRLQFVTDTEAPSITIMSPEAKTYLHSGTLTIDFEATDAGTGIRSAEADIDGMAVVDGQVIDLLTLSLGNHTLTVTATDDAWNTAVATVTFTVEATISSLRALVDGFHASGDISKAGTAKSLASKVDAAQKLIDAGKTRAAINQLKAFISEVKAQTGKSITPEAAAVLVAEARAVIASLR